MEERDSVNRSQLKIMADEFQSMGQGCEDPRGE